MLGAHTKTSGAGAGGEAHSCHELNRSFVALLDVQFWLMGRDVEHPGGNLLCRLGFIREPASTGAWSGRSAPSRYTRPAAPGSTEPEVVIWPCGMLLVASGCRSLVVRGGIPVLAPDRGPDGLYDQAEVYAQWRRGSPCTAQALAQVSRWFARYECRVDELVGIEHRVPRPDTAPSLAPPQPCSLHSEWTSLAHTLEAV